MHELTETKTGNLTTWAADINAAHADAVKHASSAIDCAKTAGALLLRAKQKLTHGAFGGWLEANCSVSERQARRYMAAAQGKPLPMRALKSDTVSVLPAMAMTPKDDAKELAAAHKTIELLDYAIEMARIQLMPIEYRLEAYELTHERRRLQRECIVLTKERDTCMTEVFHLKRQCQANRREIDRLKKAA